MASIRPNRCAESISPRKREAETDLDSCPRGQARTEAAVVILNAIYEQDFPDRSVRVPNPGPGAHQALDEVNRGSFTRPTGWILEIDITAYFDTIVREQLMEMIEKRSKPRTACSG